MKRLAILVLGCMIMTGCSELQVIGRATVRELSADAVSVDHGRYEARQGKPVGSDEKPPLVAQADPIPLMKARSAGPKQKELWVTTR